MKNKLLEEQIRSIEGRMEELQRDCELAARADNGRLSFSERRTLKKIDKAVTKFLKQIGKIKIDWEEE